MTTLSRTNTDLRRRGVLARSAVLATAVAAACLSACALAGCTTDQVFDSTRYWTDRVAGATIDADPAKD